MFLNIGVTDIPTRSRGRVDKEYLLWTSVLSRCFDKKYLKRKPTYLGCSVSEDWLTYSNFKKTLFRFMVLVSMIGSWIKTFWLEVTKHTLRIIVALFLERSISFSLEGNLS